MVSYACTCLGVVQAYTSISHSYELNVPSSGHVAYRRLAQINEVIDLMAENRKINKNREKFTTGVV